MESIEVDEIRLGLFIFGVNKKRRTENTVIDTFVTFTSLFRLVGFGGAESSDCCIKPPC